MRKGQRIALIGGIILVALFAGVMTLVGYAPDKPGPGLTVTPSDTGEGRNMTLALDESVKLKSN